MPIRLPHDALGYDYEDQVCSLLLAHGYYLETRLILKKGAEEVLEFDAIATPVNDHRDRRVIEVKSGKWGIADIFKLYGQIMYTSERSGWLIHKNKAASETKAQAVSQITQVVPVETLNLNIASWKDSDKLPEGLAIPESVAGTIFSTSWWSRSAERIAQSRFRSWCKGYAEPPKIIKDAQRYLERIDDSLFQRSPIARVHALYEAYIAAPKLTSNVISHIANSSNVELTTVRRSVFNNDQRPYVQYVTAQEFRARIGIIKNAYDALLEESEQQKAQGKDLSWTHLIAMLVPNSFKTGMEALRPFPYAHHVPFFYQVFVEVFGGFYVPSDERELTCLANATGIPPDSIPAALELIDKFFPIPNGWTHKGDRVNLLKGVPAYLRGAGCFARGSLYGEDWAKQFPQLSWQIPNWHNALYRLLEPSLRVEEDESEAQ